MQAKYFKYQLHFKRPSGTSRGVLREKETWFLLLEKEGRLGVGECALFRGLSADDVSDYEVQLQNLVDQINLPKAILIEKFKDYSSIVFGLEQAFQSLESKNPFLLFPSDFTSGVDSIPINGLVWMGTKEYMLQQINEKILAGFSVIKLKIGAIDFDEELSLLKHIRKEFSAKDIEIRVDANGAFNFDDAMEKLKRLSDFEIHSIEQPIRQGQVEKMAKLCRNSPIPVALDEELIGYHYGIDKNKFLQNIQPQYIILKPALHGGFIGTETWMNAAKQNNIGWWITSALESNVGLNAIAQYTYQLGTTMPQGLGTGSLFANNFESPLSVANGALYFDPYKKFNFRYR